MKKSKNELNHTLGSIRVTKRANKASAQSNRSKRFVKNFLERIDSSGRIIEDKGVRESN